MNFVKTIIEAVFGAGNQLFTHFDRSSSFSVGAASVNIRNNQFLVGGESCQLDRNEALLLSTILAMQAGQAGVNERDLRNLLGFSSVEEVNQAFDRVQRKLDDLTIANDAGDGGVMHQFPDGSEMAIPTLYDFTVKACHLFYKQGDTYCFHTELAESLGTEPVLSDEQMHGLNPVLKPAFYR